VPSFFRGHSHLTRICSSALRGLRDFLPRDEARGDGARLRCKLFADRCSNLTSFFAILNSNWASPSIPPRNQRLAAFVVPQLPPESVQLLLVFSYPRS
jgi:hypothetical protein